MLAKRLSFSVAQRPKAGTGFEPTDLLISGAHGAGKSTVARVLTGLLTVQSGAVTRPEADRLAIVPQQPLVPTAALSLLDMLTYPAQLERDSDAETAAIESLTPFLRRLKVFYLVERDASSEAIPFLVVCL